MTWHRPKRGRDEDSGADRDNDSGRASRHFSPVVSASIGGMEGSINMTRCAADHALYGDSSSLPESSHALNFFFDTAVLTTGQSSFSVVLSPRQGANRDITSRGNVACPVHGPFWCACEPMRMGAEKLLSLLVCSLGFPEEFPIRLAVDEHPSMPHIYIDSHTRRWAIQIVGTTLPPVCFGPFPLAAMESVPALLEQWNQYSFKRPSRPDCCAHCGIEVHSHCSLCRCFMCLGCSQNCDKCGRHTCRACCNYTDHSGTLCFPCLS